MLRVLISGYFAVSLMGYGQAVRPTIEVSRERLLLLTELSDSFKMGRRSVERHPDIHKLTPLLKSSDEEISKMAKVGSAIFSLFELANRQADITPEVQNLQLELLQFTMREATVSYPPVNDTLHNAVEIFGSSKSAFPRALAKFHDSLKTGIDIQLLQNAFRAEMKQYLVATTSGEAAGSQVSARLGSAGKILVTTPGNVVIQNLDDQVLTGACVVVDVNPNLRRLERIATEMEQQIRLSGAIQLGLGSDESTVQIQLETHRRRTLLQALGKGTFVYIGEWPQGEEVSIFADILGNIENFADNIQIHVFCDQGRFPAIILKGDDMRKLIENVVRDQSSK